ncbi:hypothetical protein ABT119_33005 [Streptomyces sp. NPDC001910]|uniref:hypothetical protein n=1 Tax=Streptomyces sp. NPDC001910 TaxID=3154403 RepID=UPI00332D332D
MDPFTVFEHAGCLTQEEQVADPALPDGMATGDVGIPVSSAFRRKQQGIRGTHVGFTSDPINPLAGVKEEIACCGLTQPGPGRSSL